MNAFGRRTREWCSLSLLVLPLALAAEPDPVEAVGKAAGEWVKTRAETVRLQSDWSSQRELLEATVRAVQERANNLETKRDDLKARTAQEQDELQKMEAKNQAMSAALQGAGDRLKTLDGKLVHLRPSLPPRLSAALELPYRSLAAADLPLGERMQLTMTVLNRCVQFNRVITHGEEVIQLPGDTEARALDVIYWGLSHGYALDRKAGRAWLGAPGPEGWKWEPQADAAPAVARLISIVDDKTEPEFVTVPARLQHAGAANSNP